MKKIRVKSKKKVAKKAAKKKADAKSKKPTLLQRIAASKKELQKAKDKTVKVGQKFFKEAVKDVFKKFKTLERFSWDQYTAHWNDGDPCVFETYFDSLAINDEREENNVEYVDSLERMRGLLANKEKEEARIVLELAGKSGKDNWEIDRLKSDLETLRTRDFKEVATKYEIKRAIKDFLENIDESVYEDMFGEGTVVVTRDGTTVEECEHD